MFYIYYLISNILYKNINYFRKVVKIYLVIDDQVDNQGILQQYAIRINDKDIFKCVHKNIKTLHDLHSLTKITTLLMMY